MISCCYSQDRGFTGPRTGPQPRRIGVQDVRDEENDSDRSNGYEYRAYYSSSENRKKILEVDQNQSSMSCNVYRCKT